MMNEGVIEDEKVRIEKLGFTAVFDDGDILYGMRL